MFLFSFCSLSRISAEGLCQHLGRPKKGMRERDTFARKDGEEGLHCPLARVGLVLGPVRILDGLARLLPRRWRHCAARGCSVSQWPSSWETIAAETTHRNLKTSQAPPAARQPTGIMNSLREENNQGVPGTVHSSGLGQAAEPPPPERRKAIYGNLASSALETGEQGAEALRQHSRSLVPSSMPQGVEGNSERNCHQIAIH